MLVASIKVETPDKFRMEMQSSFTGSDDGNHWVAIAVSQDEKARVLFELIKPSVFFSFSCNARNYPIKVVG